jgi:hypothetical protein
MDLNFMMLNIHKYFQKPQVPTWDSEIGQISPKTESQTQDQLNMKVIQEIFWEKPDQQ